LIKQNYTKYFFLLLSFSLFFQVILRVESLSTSVLDLGIFSSNLSSIYDDQWRAISGHIQPLMYIWGAIYQLFDPVYAPMVLVSIQFLFVLGSAWWVWREFGTLPGFAMLLYYPLWTNVLFDFHFDHLSIPILTAFFIFCDKKRFKLAALVATSLVLIKEPFSLQVIFCGVYMIWLAFRVKDKIHTNSLLWLSSGLIFVGLVWFYISMYMVLPYFSGVDGVQGGAYTWLGTGMLDKLYTVTFRPDIWLIDIFNNPDKLKLLLIIFGSLAFISLLRPAPLIVALPPLLIMLLSHEDNYYGYANHYTAGVIVPAIIAFKDGLPIALKLWRRLLSYIGSKNKLVNDSLPKLLIVAFLLVGHWALASSPISRLFWSDKVWSYSWQAYIPTKRDSMIKEALLEYIPSDSEVSVSTQNSLNYGHLSSRKLYLPFPQGVVDPHPVLSWGKEGKDDLLGLIYENSKASAKYDKKLVDYVVLDSKRPWFVIDQGCDWLYGRCTNDKVANEYLGWVEKTKSIMQVVFERDGFIILKRNSNGE
jgi:uncharacterized membrane protein